MQINTLLQQAYSYHQQGDFARAQPLYQQILQLEPENQDALLLLGSLSYDLGAYAHAVEHFERLLALAPERTDFLTNLGAALQLLGRAQAAAEIYRRAVTVEPHSAPARYNLGTALKDCGDFAAAAEALSQALALDPHHAKAHNQLGSVLQQLGESERAKSQFAAAVKLQPGYALAWMNLGDSERRQGQLTAAEAAYQQAVALLPQTAELHYKLGTLYQQLGRLEASEGHLRYASELQPEVPEVWRSLGATEQALGRYQDSTASFERAIALRPDYGEAFNNLGNSLRELGDTDAARTAYEKALAVQPSDANRVRLATLLPPIYGSLDEVGRWRERYTGSLQALTGQNLRIEDPLTEVGQTNFYLAYQGGDDRPLQELAASLYRPLLPESVEPDSPPVRGSRRRVGVLSAFLYNHTVSHYYHRHLELLAAAEDIELILLFAPGNQQDQTSAELTALAEKTVQLPKDLAQARRLTANLGLDVLVYLDIGLEPFSYFLAFTRLAPVQCVLPGHPVTTGIPTVDYYVSNTWMEHPQADADYSEKLVALESLPVWYKKPALPAQLKSRQELGLSQQARLYVCPMTLFKIHPQMDATLARILAEDAEARILFFRFRQTQLHEQLEQRFAREIPDHDRISFLPWADSLTYFSLLNTAEVLLDSFHFGGGSTHFLCFGTGTPMVTWPSAYLRGRSGAGIYRRIGVEGAIADSPEAYAETALRIAQNADLRQDLRAQILAKSAIIFENDEGPISFVEWIRSLPQS